MMARILIVDDESGIRKLLTVVFREAGYQVRTAATIAQAMALCDSEAFDVLFSDVMIGDTNGHDLVRWAACHHPQVHCLLMSGFELECHDWPSTPRCPVITKPFRPYDVIRMVNRILAHRNVA
jgi:DNA-binding NtrC family response regulator